MIGGAEYFCKTNEHESVNTRPTWLAILTVFHEIRPYPIVFLFLRLVRLLFLRLLVLPDSTLGRCVGDE